MSTKNSLTLTKKYRQTLSIVHMIYRLVNSTYNVQELILRLTRLLCQFSNAERASIYIFDSEKKKVILKGIFDSKINILVTKKSELAIQTKEEKRVLDGYMVFEDEKLGLPLVADDNIGAVLLERSKESVPFNDDDRELLQVVVEQSVTAIKNLQLHEQQEQVILESIKFIGKLLKKHGHEMAVSHTPAYFKIVKMIAEKLSMGKNAVDNLYYASVLRDAGAIDIPYEILSKRGQLTNEEFKIIQQQPKRSAEFIKSMDFLSPVLPIILYHHENYDGTGYPSGLKGEQIPLGARILSVVDAFKAMTSERPYKQRLTINEAIHELKHNSGSQFDPKVVEVFIYFANTKKFRKYLSEIK